MKPFQLTQLAFAEYLRRADASEPRSRNQEIYRESVFKNINQCIADVLPRTRRLVGDSQWESMVREFIQLRRSRTPYFSEICQEFLAYLMQIRTPLPTDPPFTNELAHFEWIQFALYIADAELPERQSKPPPTEKSLWKASPILVGLTYLHPVHIIDENYFPASGLNDPTYLLAYRGNDDEVAVLETDNLGLRVIQLLQEHQNISYVQQFNILAGELDPRSRELLSDRLRNTLRALSEMGILYYQ